MSGPLWRVGSKVPRNLYEGDRDVGRMDTPELAARVVAAMNERARWQEEGARLVAGMLESGNRCAELERALENVERINRHLQRCLQAAGVSIRGPE